MTALPWSLEFLPVSPGFELTLAFDAATGRLQVKALSTASRSRRLQALVFRATLDLPAASGLARLNAASSADSDVLRPFGRDQEVPGSRAAVRLASDTWIEVYCPARAFPCLVVGSLDPGGRVSLELELDADETVVRALLVTVNLDGEAIAPGQALGLPFYVAEGRDLADTAATYADAVADVAGIVRLPQPPALVSAPASPVAWEGAAVVVDPATLAGPEAAADLAREARAAGAVPLLHVTASAAVDALAGDVARACDAWGFAGVILDFDGESADPAAARTTLQAVRAAAGAPRLVVARSLPLVSAPGLVDLVILPLTPSADPAEVSRAARSLLLRTAFDGRTWLSAAELPAAALNLPDAAWRTALTAAALAGFPLVLAGDEADLPPARLAMVRSLVPPTGLSAVQIPSGEPSPLAAWRASLPGERTLVGILNGGGTPQWVSPGELLRPGEVGFDFWGAKLLPMGDVLLQPWDAALWQVAGQGRGARLVGDAGSLTSATLFQRSVSGRLQLGNDLDRPRTIAVHARGETFTATLSPGERRWFD